MKPPVLETERLILRELRLSDTDSYQYHVADWEVAKTLPKGFPWPYPEDGGQKFIENALGPDNKSFIWAITLKNNPDKVIGIIELRPQKDDNQRGFWLGRKYHGQGLMTEAATITMDYWFDVLNKPFLRTANARGNIASSKMKDKFGRLIHTEAAEYHDPALVVREVWEITAADWKVFRARAIE